MDGMHDLGGRQGFGKVGIVPEASPFQAPWEQRAYALRTQVNPDAGKPLSDEERKHLFGKR